MELTKSLGEKNKVLNLVKAVAISLILTLGLILIFALLLKFCNISEKAIYPVNLFIKAASITVGTLILTKDGTAGFIKGLIFGLVFSVCAFILFSLMLGSFSFSMGVLIDLIFGAAVGAIVGVIRVNFKK